MSYTVKIEYTGTSSQKERVCEQIFRRFCPSNAYVDTSVYTEGYPADEDDKTYGRSVYATNVKGFGSTRVPEPYATTSIPFSSPLAQFKLAIVGDDNVAEFEVSDYKEALYYQSLGAELHDQGLVVTISSSSDSSSSSDTDSSSDNDDSSEVTAEVIGDTLTTEDGSEVTVTIDTTTIDSESVTEEVAELLESAGVTSEDYTILSVTDITLTDADGNEVSSEDVLDESGVQIKLTSDSIVSDGSYYILHQTSDGEWEVIVPDEIGDGYIIATFTSLSPIVLVEGEVPESLTDTTIAKVSTADELATALVDESIITIKLTSDFETVTDGTPVIEIARSLTLELNGHNVTSTGTETCAAIKVTAGDVIINDGEGTSVITASGGSDYNICVWAKNSNVTINGGTYASGTAETSEDGEAVYASGTGVITINDGTFSNASGNITTHHPDWTYVINIQNNSGASITCYGGKYLNQNPADGDDEDTTTGTTFLADGCTVETSETDEGTWYTVVAA